MRIKEGNKEKDILEAAIKVFAEVGYHKAKIAKIAEVAEVAAGSVYLYFKDKEDILLKIFENIWRKLYTELKSIKENDDISPFEKFDSMIDLIFDIYIENPNLALVFVNEQNHIQRSAEEYFTEYYEKFLNLGEEIIKEGIQKNQISSSVDIKILRYFIFGAIKTLLQHWAVDPKNYPLNKIRQNIKFIIKYGIEK
ncbi:TetR/AcrR family transcriptional regulator [Stygiobacter electus]|uniref:TetR/AcrR family transcriptional regulator n=1 Tax=Stygiobacter electus TaxID=3032292 RepID=A0AAE3P1A0_9BACT|nr:TetR/AcrR family transcriptional regulator [Stygiobacter electus]MDF1611887.1 TetR/AcrR family transcriptional regulator [Stygiobacter electus]